MKPVALVVAFALMLMSCASTVRYTTDAVLSSETFRSTSGVLSGNIPQGWFTSQETATSALECWLLRDDLSAAIVIRELYLDSMAKQAIMKEGMLFAGELSRSFLPNDTSVTFTQVVKEFTLQKREMCSYEVKVGGMNKRVVVFPEANRLFECEAASLKNLWTKEELTALFTIQQTVLSSLFTQQPTP